MNSHWRSQSTVAGPAEVKRNNYK